MPIPEFIKNVTNGLTEKYTPSNLKKASSLLTAAYESNKGDNSRIVTSEELAAAYCAVRMPATYESVYSALSHTVKNCQIKINSMLDVGTGTGAAFFAASALFDISRAVLVEREKNMLSLAGRFCDAGGLKAELIRSDARTFETSEKFDLVTVSYALNEIDTASREKLLDKLSEYTNKLLLIVEPGTPAAFHLQKEIRRYMAAKGRTLVAPCPETGNCPLPENDWCHFSCRVQRSKLHKFVKGGDAPFEDEKFSYSAFCFDNSLSPCNARVLRHPFTDKGKITLCLCTDCGIKTHTLFKSEKEPYKAARKLNCGDDFNFKTQ